MNWFFVYINNTKQLLSMSFPSIIPDVFQPTKMTSSVTLVQQDEYQLN